MLAWIEICHKTNHNELILVASYMLAWIEIAAPMLQRALLHVASYMLAWIEIFGDDVTINFEESRKLYACGD